MRIFVGPRPDDRLARGAQALHQPRNGVGIGIVPPAHHQGWRLDRRPVFAHRPVLPIIVAVRMLEPRDQQEGLVLQPLHPHPAPLGAHDLGVRRARRIGQHGGGPAEILVDQAAALVMNVVFIAIIGRTDGDDGLERRWLPRRHLQRIEAAPRDAHHADLAGRPFLPGDPRDHFQRVVLLLLAYSSCIRPSESPLPRMSTRIAA